MEDKNNTAAKTAQENDLSVSGRQGITGIEEPNNSTDKVENLKNKANEVKEKVSANLSGAAKTVHSKANKAGEYAQQAADKAGEYAHQAVDKANQFGHKAADAIASSSEYLKNFDLDEKKQQVKETFKENPGLTVAVAGIFGLLLGLLLGRKKQ